MMIMFNIVLGAANCDDPSTNILRPGQTRMRVDESCNSR